MVTVLRKKKVVRLCNGTHQWTFPLSEVANNEPQFQVASHSSWISWETAKLDLKGRTKTRRGYPKTNYYSPHLSNSETSQSKDILVTYNNHLQRRKRCFLFWSEEELMSCFVLQTSQNAKMAPCLAPELRPIIHFNPS